MSCKKQFQYAISESYSKSIEELPADFNTWLGENGATFSGTDRIIVLEKGEIREQGTQEELYRKKKNQKFPAHYYIIRVA